MKQEIPDCKEYFVSYSLILDDIYTYVKQNTINGLKKILLDHVDCILTTYSVGITKNLSGKDIIMIPTSIPDAEQKLQDCFTELQKMYDGLIKIDKEFNHET